MFKTLATATVLAACMAMAASAEDMVFTSWGGTTQDAQAASWATPFTEKTGIAVLQDGPTDYGKLKAMVESGNVDWDVVDVEYDFAIAAAKMGLLEPIDFGVVDRAAIDPRFVIDHAVGSFYYSFVIGFNKDALTGEPASWADVFDTAKFPGKRSLYKWANGALEGALLADGVDKNALYPLDMDRALAKIKSIKDDSLYWGSGSEAHSMVVNGEVSMGMIWQNRGRNIEMDTDGRYKLVMNEALAMPGAYIVPKGNPAGREAVMKFIATAQSVPSQLTLLDCLGMTPSNPEAFAQIPEDQQPYAITSAMNIDGIVYSDPTWWGENGGDAVNAFLEAIS